MADSKDSDQTGRVPKLIWVFVGVHATLLDLFMYGLYILPQKLPQSECMYRNNSKYWDR